MTKAATIKRTKSALGLCAALCLLISGCTTTEGTPMALIDGKLPPCPDSPNCVSSQAQQSAARIEPLYFNDAPDAAWIRLHQALRQLGGTIEQDNDHYLWVTFVSRLLRFTDDMEFLLDPEQQRIELRSASRVGYWDLGVNRKRAEALRQLFEQPAAP